MKKQILMKRLYLMKLINNPKEVLSNAFPLISHAISAVTSSVVLLMTWILKTPSRFSPLFKLWFFCVNKMYKLMEKNKLVEHMYKKKMIQ